MLLRSTTCATAYGREVWGKNEEPECRGFPQKARDLRYASRSPDPPSTTRRSSLRPQALKFTKFFGKLAAVDLRVLARVIRENEAAARKLKAVK